MPNSQAEYEKLVGHYANDASVVAGNLFGKPCLKVSSKAFVARQNDVIAFKLSGAQHQKAMGMPGAALWDPSGKGRPMKEWVALPATASRGFKAFAAAAYEYVASEA